MPLIRRYYMIIGGVVFLAHLFIELDASTLAEKCPQYIGNTI